MNLAELTDRLEEEVGELSDVLAHTLLMARHLGFDLARELDRKWLVHHPDKGRRDG